MKTLSKVLVFMAALPFALAFWRLVFTTIAWAFGF